MSLGRKILSDLKLYSDYLKWDEEKQRYETWDEACENVLETHILKYGEKVRPLTNKVLPFYKSKKLLASQRNLQFRGKQILKHESRLYNCCTMYAYSPDLFEKAFYVLLCGCGLGVSLKNKYVGQLPDLYIRNKGTKTYIVDDSIEGWAKSVKVLISSYCKHLSLIDEYFGYNIKFDYSQIRPKGAFITGGFKAPGHEGLKQSLERIELLINSNLKEEKNVKFKSIIVYDILMHISDAVLSGGVRRSAMNIIMDLDDKELMYAKIGNWRSENPQRARSNNSVGLLKGQFTKKQFNDIIRLNEGDNDIGFVFLNDNNEILNPCYEIGFNFYDEIVDKNYISMQFCNLNEINASTCVDKEGNFSEQEFYDICEAAAILGTLQAGYTNFPNINKQTEKIVAGEALLGVSITGWATRPELFDENILKRGAEIVKKTNKETAKALGINPAARCTTVKPSGNASVILQTASGIHPEHSKNYLRVMQLNKDSEVAKFLNENYPETLEESVWSASNTDYAVFMTFENNEKTLFKDELKGVKHLELIKLVQNSWVKYGKNENRCYKSTTNHNVSNTVIIDDFDEIVDYIFDNQNVFTAVSFVSQFSDKDYNQAPNTSVLESNELIKKYGDGAIFASGLIVDGLHHYNDLWEATDTLLNKDREKNLSGTRDQVLLKKDWLRRARKFSRNYFKGNIEHMVYCLKDVHLWHKWNSIKRVIKPIDFQEILKEPVYADISDYGSMACSGGSCEV